MVASSRSSSFAQYSPLPTGRGQSGLLFQASSSPPSGPIFSSSGIIQAPLPVAQTLPGLADVADPNMVIAQKQEYSRDLQDQLKKGLQVLAETRQKQLDALHSAANQEKTRYNLSMDQQVKQQELMLSQEYNEQLMRLQQAAQAKRAELEQQATSLTLEFQQRKVMEEFLAQQAGIQQQHHEAQCRLEEEMNKLGVQSSPLPGFGLLNPLLSSPEPQALAEATALQQPTTSSAPPPHSVRCLVGPTAVVPYKAPQQTDGYYSAASLSTSASMANRGSAEVVSGLNTSRSSSANLQPCSTYVIPMARGTVPAYRGASSVGSITPGGHLNRSTSGSLSIAAPCQASSTVLAPGGATPASSTPMVTPMVTPKHSMVPGLQAQSPGPAIAGTPPNCRVGRSIQTTTAPQP